MGSRSPRMAIATAATIILLSLSVLTAAKLLAPQTEEMTVNEARVTVDYLPRASADDLAIPFYPGAEVKDSFVYLVTTPAGKQVLSYASAILVSADQPAVVASRYHDLLPGRPEAETQTGEAGERITLAVSQGDEVRMVTITAADGGSRIELVRATKPVPPPKPLRPQGRERVT